MARLVSFLVLFGSLVYVSALPSNNVIATTSSETQTNSIAALLSRRLVDIFSTKLTSAASYFQLKIRIVSFLASLYTDQNLMLLRDVIRQGVRFANFVLKVTPKSINDPGFEWVMFITELIRTSNATEELLGTFLGSRPVTSSETPDELLSEHHEHHPDPPISLNADILSENTDSNEVQSTAASSGAPRGNREVNEDDFVPADDRVIALEKLINARRK